jgi:serine/threonine protein kinase
MDSEKGVKIRDFGVSKIIKRREFIKERCGTPAYLAPEIIYDAGYEGLFVCTWSLGVLLRAIRSNFSSKLWPIVFCRSKITKLTILLLGYMIKQSVD